MKLQLASESNVSTAALQLEFRDLHTPSCAEQEPVAIHTLTDELFRKGTNVTVIVGPSCTDSAYAISRLTSRREVPILHLHTSPMPARLASSLDSSFAVLGPVELLADASIALLQHSNWSRVMAFYQDTDTNMNCIFEQFQEKLAETNSTDRLGHFSIVHSRNVHNPLRYALSNHAIRVLYLMLDRERAREILCQGYHLRAVYPAYQWVLLHATPEDILSTTQDVYTDTGETCDRSDLLVVLDQALFLGYHVGGTGRGEGIGRDQSNVTAHHSNTTAYHDALKLLLGGLRRLESEGLSLRESLRQEEIAVDRQIVLRQLRDNTSTIVARYDTADQNLTLSQENEPNLIPSNFTRISNAVSQEFFYVTLALLATQVLITVVLQTLTIYYRRRKCIRATSPKIQQLAYVGTYLVISAILIYSLQKSQVIEDTVYARLCVVYHTVNFLGYTLLLSILCIKAWRLYRIFNHFQDPGHLLSDGKLVVVTLSMLLVTVIICTLWGAVGRPVRTEVPLRVDFERRVEIVRDNCRTRYLLLWFVLVYAYLGILLLTATGLSITVNASAPKYQKQFRRNEVTLLAYLIVVTLIVGLPTYYLARFITGNLVFEYIVTVAISVSTIVSYQVLFFASPLLHALKEKKSHSVTSTNCTSS